MTELQHGAPVERQAIVYLTKEQKYARFIAYSHGVKTKPNQQEIQVRTLGDNQPLIIPKSSVRFVRWKYQHETSGVDQGDWNFRNQIIPMFDDFRREKDLSWTDELGIKHPKWSQRHYAIKAVVPKRQTNLSHEKELFNDQDYADGVGFSSMAEHVSDMSQLDRLINETCYNGFKVSRPEPQLTDRRLWWQKPLKLQRNIEKSRPITLASCQHLIDSWTLLDFRTKEALDAIHNVKTKAVWYKASQRSGALIEHAPSIENAVIYYRNLAQNLELVTVHADEFVVNGEQYSEDHEDEALTDEERFYRELERDFELEGKDKTGPVNLDYYPIGERPEDRAFQRALKNDKKFKETFYYLIENRKNIRKTASFGRRLHQKPKLFSPWKQGWLWKTYNAIKASQANRSAELRDRKVRQLSAMLDIGKAGNELKLWLRKAQMLKPDRDIVWQKLLELQKSGMQPYNPWEDNIPYDDDPFLEYDTNPYGPGQEPHYENIQCKICGKTANISPFKDACLVCLDTNPTFKEIGNLDYETVEEMIGNYEYNGHLSE
jgi:hypothetical protein